MLSLLPSLSLSLPHMSLAAEAALGPISRELDTVTPIRVVPGAVVDVVLIGGAERKLTLPTADLFFLNKARRECALECGTVILCLPFCLS